ncbi:ROK family transcriptional regulator [Actinoplanes derwentensis]|uniref:Sugar kinase of the NBD/HSP70 family, may contain an N-terminal HTH domain n=1 Tax=Actinoplanes derwentensis TaxID=113562 RepID=A0A1H1SPC9_9ACTN|nr:ROK family transcriptional regulator [Actinoplanes derwentensis]GID83247.1 sugar kinase [Actinoplanes derwentensis]SDS49761.1 Sugar kinase of the NBD/HSP70 family, may contain an N-terminal HTH domain [Actinoplanes derwentensis]
MSETVGEVPGGRPGRGRRPAARESVLDAIRAAEQLSRVELASITGLTEAAVSMTVRRLLDEGLLVETGRTPTGGKPRTMLRLDPAARLSVGIHLDRDVTTFVLTGQTGGVISRLARPAGLARPASANGHGGVPGSGVNRTRTRHTEEPVVSGGLLAHLTDGIGLLLTASGVDRARCLGIGVVWPGPRDDVPHLRGWDATELGKRLTEESGRPVLVENDATAAAVGEYWVARVGADRAFAALHMGAGIGAGIVVEGRALRGGHGSAGEFGHMCVQVDGPECWCGSRGCLETLAGPRTVVEAARSDPRAVAEAGLAPGVPRGVTADFAAIARAARAGAPRCLALLEDSARYVAAAAESVVNLLDIGLLVLTGPGFAAASFVYGPAIMRRIQPADTRTWHRTVTVTVSLAAATASATGAAALILQSDLRRQG